MNEPAPPGLLAAGKRLWQSVTSGWDLRADELANLASAARLADEIAAMERALKGQPLVVTASRGAVKPHPLLPELRNHRMALNRILVSLQLPEPGAEYQVQSRSAAGRALVRMRWGHRGA